MDLIFVRRVKNNKRDSTAALIRRDGSRTVSLLINEMEKNDHKKHGEVGGTSHTTSLSLGWRGMYLKAGLLGG